MRAITIFCVIVVLTFNVSVYSQWQHISSFEDEKALSVFSTFIAGNSSVNIVKDSEKNQCLVLDLKEGREKSCMVALKNPPQIDGKRPLLIAWDMKLSKAQGGYKKGLRYGRADRFVEAGRYGTANFSSQKGDVFFNDQLSDLPFDISEWLHYELVVSVNKQTLKVYEYNADFAGDPEKYHSMRPVFKGADRQQLSSYGNSLIVYNEKVFHKDWHSQERGRVYFDDLWIYSEQDTVEEKGDSYSLIKDGIVLNVSKDTGLISGVNYSDSKLIDESQDEYFLTLKNGEILAQEKFDKVISGSNDGDLIVVTCQNKLLDNLLITKKYSIENGSVVKKVEFKSEKDSDGFLVYRSGLKFGNNVTKDGLFHTLKGWDVATHLPTRDVIAEMRLGHPLSNTGNQMLMLVRPDINITIAEFLYKVDDKFVWPQNFIYKEITAYNPNGWRYPVFMFHPEKGLTRSCEKRYKILQGDQFDFHKYYKAIPEVKASLETNSPEWIANSKIDIVNWTTHTPTKFAALAQGLIDLSKYTDDEYAICTQWGWATWSHIPTEEDEEVVALKKGKEKEMKSTQWLVDELENVHKDYPNIKYGLYHFLTSLAPQSDFGIEKESWQAKGPDGKILPQPEPGWTAAYRLMTAPGSMEYLYTKMKRELERFDTDFIYIDGGSKSISSPDWSRMQVDQSYVFVDMWKKLLDITRSTGDDKAMFYNYYAFPYGDIGYLETGSFKRDYGEDWRKLAELMLVAKIYQGIGHDYTGVLYRTVEPAYTNMILASGLRPTGSKDPNVYPDWKRLFGYISYINLAYELGLSKYVDAVVSPKFWVDVDGECPVQAMSLKQGDSLIVSLVNHSQKVEEFDLKLDFKKAGLDIFRPIYVWRQDVEKAEFIEREPIEGPCDPEEVKNVVSKKFLGLVGDISRGFKAVSVDPESLAYLVFSNNPTIVNSVGYQKTQLWLSENRNISTEYSENKGNREVVVNCDAPKGEITVYMPDVTKVPVIEGNFGYSRHEFSDNTTLLVRIGVKRGQNRVTISF